MNMQTFQHQNYELQCSAKALEGGTFCPHLVISKMEWPTRPREIAVERGKHITAESAIEAARLGGLLWIENYG
jgi:hypothetical protein